MLLRAKKYNILPHFVVTFFPCYSGRRENVEECAAGQELLDAVTLDERQLKGCTLLATIGIVYREI